MRRGDGEDGRPADHEPPIRPDRVRRRGQAGCAADREQERSTADRRGAHGELLLVSGLAHDVPRGRQELLAPGQ
jgi:hypothetical protein